ncbi:hypothetical protein [Streptomyces kanamyceticus]|uniref:hypothetical protein n=1 Tax=Streptomyces kanamyceticus TaxID=1967 RepID=UPI0037DD6F65
MSAYYQGYRKDRSGFVSMAWGLGSNQCTGSLAAYGVRIGKSQLKPGDMLLFHNLSHPGTGSHVTISGGWTDSSKTRYMAYEATQAFQKVQGRQGAEAGGTSGPASRTPTSLTRADVP